MIILYVSVTTRDSDNAINSQKIYEVQFDGHNYKVKSFVCRPNELKLFFPDGNTLTTTTYSDFATNLK